MESIFNFSLGQLETKILSLGFKKYIAKQIFEWIYDKMTFDFTLMTNISKENQQKLASSFSFDLLKLIKKQESKDGTVKFLFSLSDDLKIETVLMRQAYGNSVCVTTQVGCNMGCTFCASGLLKKTRNLSAAEILLQIIAVNNYLKISKERVSHIVVMGIGEPFDNFDNLINFLYIVNDSSGFNIGARHITVSTCGLVPKILQFADVPLQVNLAISLHAPTNEIRNKLMPINKVYPLEKLIPAVKTYIEKTNRRVTFEYILIDKINDSKENALELAKLIRGLNAYVNLIPYNEVKENPFQRSKNINSFFQVLQAQKINCIVRKEYGHDIDAACGQLRAKNEGLMAKNDK